MIKRGILLMVVLVGSAMPMAGEAAPTPRVRDGASGKGGAASKKKSIAPVTATDKVKAAALFKAGQALYNAGRFGEAIAAFSKAQVLAPHPFSLFNIARCHENLGRPRAALRFYREALAATSDPKLTKDLQSRIARLQRFPSKIFVTSDPPGATVTLDGAAAPRAKRTPLVVTLPAGEHVLLFRKEGHILVVRRVELRAGREVTVRVSLPRRRPKPVPCPAPLPIPPCPRCRDARLMTFTGLHLHVALNGGFAIAKDLGAVAGPGVQVSATIDRFRVGVHFQYLPVNPSSLAKLAGTQERSSFMQGQAEGGYTFPFGRFHLYATVGVGLYLNRL
ncbi:MAG: PEGA domain-containing protein, partial [Deltaproteobacteria bacterium]|nr:PEGA domain-containing protein [Deltaproteobacteria bacterium]